jgi:hypothetical protein
MSFHKFSELPFLMNLVFAPEFFSYVAPRLARTPYLVCCTLVHLKPRFKLTPYLWLGCTKSGAG